ncbi:hypothetical protein FB480_10527 [Agrobacterium vitis]|nr:hypothetical protein FB480_10527 [Agrobacterium vitis]
MGNKSRSNTKNLPREEVRQVFRKEPNDSWEEECCHSNGPFWEEE